MTAVDPNYCLVGTQRASSGAVSYRVGFGKMADSDAVFHTTDGY